MTDIDDINKILDSIKSEPAKPGSLKRLVRRWRLIPKISYTNFRKECPQASPACWRSWFSVKRYWSGRIINISVKHHTLELDFRKNWIADMISPNDQAEP